MIPRIFKPPGRSRRMKPGEALVSPHAPYFIGRDCPWPLTRPPRSMKSHGAPAVKVKETIARET